MVRGGVGVVGSVVGVGVWGGGLWYGGLGDVKFSPDNLLIVKVFKPLPIILSEISHL